MKNLLLAVALLFSVCLCHAQQAGITTITRWPGNKTGAVSITFDDGSINQFKRALPILNRLKLKAAFFIITGQIPGSKYQGKFIGRPVKDIIAETAAIPTDNNNFYERASAAGYLGLVGPLDYHYQAGSLIDAGNPLQAYSIIPSTWMLTALPGPIYANTPHRATNLPAI